jgi:hypothetical protein
LLHCSEIHDVMNFVALQQTPQQNPMAPFFIESAILRLSSENPMPEIDEVCREVWNATEFVAIVSNGPEGPHVVGTWGEYVRKLGLRDDIVVMPGGKYRRTEENLGRDERITLLIASRQVAGTNGPGQGCEISGRGEFVSEGPLVDEAKQHFPWARGVLVVHVEKVRTQL